MSYPEARAPVSMQAVEMLQMSGHIFDKYFFLYDCISCSPVGLSLQG